MKKQIKKIKPLWGKQPAIDAICKMPFVDALTKASMLKEAKASCELDGCTQCGTINPVNEMSCTHFNKNKCNEEYIYDISKTESLSLCKECHMILASKIMEQLALEVFLK